jgi:hypothetical protein
VTVELFHKAPEGYHYEQQKDFKRNTTAIWLHHHQRYDYNLGKPVKTIWGFYNTKTRQFHAPVNSQTVGNVVDIEETTPYTAMPIKQTPLEAAFG